jgi:hypothetical protein
MNEAREFQVSLQCPGNPLWSDSWLIYSSTYEEGGPRTAVFDLAEWPPIQSRHELDESALCTAVSPTGELLVFCSPNRNPPRKWLLRWYARVSDPRPVREEPVPFAAPDLSEMLATMNETDRYIESGQTHEVDAVHFVGERALLEPRQVGIRSFHPWIARKEMTELTERRDTKAIDDANGRPSVASAAGDGADVLIWNRHARGRARSAQLRARSPARPDDDSPLIPGEPGSSAQESAWR